jgi:hypothetical protein
MDRDFWLTQNALFQLADFALAFGYEEPFDENSDDDIERVVMYGLGVILVTVKTEGYTKSDGQAGTKYNAAFFGKYKGQKKESWQEYIDAGEKSFAGYLTWRGNNPRGVAGQGGGGRSSYQQRNQGNQGNQGNPGDEPPPFDGDVPF